MATGPLFLDTFFIIALLNSNDNHHDSVKSYVGILRDAAKVITTEAVLIESANALASKNRGLASKFVRKLRAQQNVEVVPVTTDLFLAGLDYYDVYADKEWGLTDCISFVVMNNLSISDALTGDKHFVQAGFRPLF